MVALDDLLVAEHGVENLGPKPHVAYRADPAARLGDRDAVSALRHHLEKGQHLPIERCHELCTLPRDPVERGFQRVEFGRLCLPVGVHRLLFGGEVRLRLLELRGEVVGLEHALENGVFELLDFRLSELDFLLHRLIFDVRLHRHQLIAELGKAALLYRDVLFDAPPDVLVLAEALLRGGGRAGARRRGGASKAFWRSGSSASRRWASLAAESSR